MAVKTVLIIDTDEKFISNLNEFFFKEADIKNVVTAASVKEGLQQIKKYKPDIVLLDLLPTDINSFDAIQIITQLSSNIRVLVTTDVFNKDYCNAVFEAGADAFIDKDNFKEDMNTILTAVPKNIQFLFEKYLISKN